MYFKQFYLGCLAHASYLIGSEGEAVVVDPQRDVDQYIAEAEAQSFKIKYVIETHLHADFVSGHRELAARTGAEIVFSEKAEATFAHRAVSEGDEIKVGKVVLRILETPGHTPESICVLIGEEQGANSEQQTTNSQQRTAVSEEQITDVTDLKFQTPNSRSQVSEFRPRKILTGDTLFIGDVGRPDLAGGKGYTPQMMAGMMYDSLHEKLLALPDDVEVYPAHGAGSMCGKNMSKETSSTIGEQRKFNYALKPMSKDEFVRMMTGELTDAPAYFSKDAEINRTGAEPLSELPKPPALSPKQVQELTKAAQTNSLLYDQTTTPQTNSLLYDQTKATQTDSQPYVILDVRSAAEFGAGHVPGSLNIGLGGQFAIWAGSLIPLEAPIIIVAGNSAQVDEAQLRLARVGLENVKGFLAGGTEAWSAAGFDLSTVPQISVNELDRLLAERNDLQVIDVRRAPEYESGHVPRAHHAPLLTLDPSIGELPIQPDKPTAVICAGGFRSSAAASILEQHGFTNLLNVTGGTGAWINAGLAVEIPPRN